MTGRFRWAPGANPTGTRAARLELAREAANGRDVRLRGGAQAIQQYMAAGLLDELELHVIPVLLGDGERLLDNLGDAEPQLEQVRAVGAPGVTPSSTRCDRPRERPRFRWERHRIR